MRTKSAKAFAPATVANVAVGFDILGFALAGWGETAEVERIPKTRKVVIEPVPGFPELPLDPMKNTATAGLVRLINERNLDFGFRVRLSKSIPIGSGLGGSSTSAVAALVAANALLGRKLKREELLDYALTGEAVASGARHGDNIGPCLYGGMVFVRTHPHTEVVGVPTPSQMRCVIILPALSIQTKAARTMLKTDVSLKHLVEQSGNLCGFILGCADNNFALIKSSLRDVVIEPQRAKLIPGFYELQQAAENAGALGFSISGSGPAMFALVKGPATARKVEQALVNKCQSLGLKLHVHGISSLQASGARLVR